MSLLNNNKNAGKKGGKAAKGTASAAKNFVKATKAANVGKAKLRTGGTRGS
jgi:hypothetical protein